MRAAEDRLLALQAELALLRQLAATLASDAPRASFTVPGGVADAIVSDLAAFPAARDAVPAPTVMLRALEAQCEQLRSQAALATRLRSEAEAEVALLRRGVRPAATGQDSELPRHGRQPEDAWDGSPPQRRQQQLAPVVDGLRKQLVQTRVVAKNHAASAEEHKTRCPHLFPALSLSLRVR